MTLATSMLAIAVGAACGANLRWLLGRMLNHLLPSLPPGTLAANLLGAFLIGLAMAMFAALPQLSPFWRLSIVTGFLGALTTFSTFSAEIFTQIQASRFGWALAGIAIHVMGSLLAVGIGIGCVQALRWMIGAWR